MFNYPIEEGGRRGNLCLSGEQMTFLIAARVDLVVNVVKVELQQNRSEKMMEKILPPM